METFADAPWSAPCTSACGCGRHHMHTIFRVIDGRPKWFLSMEHLDAFNRAHGGISGGHGVAHPHALSSSCFCNARA
jgi:hypothetical protein